MTAVATPRILIVEDDEPSRSALGRRLSRRGYQILLAGDGRAGVSVARLERPDLILMDLGLPGMDGWTATRTLKSDERTQHIPVIILSAHALAEHRDEALAAGGDEFDTKPVQFEQLLEKIETLINRSKVA